MSVVPPNKTRWRIAGKSDVGMVRHTNEDSFFCDDVRGAYFVVSDGVGGLDFGERASRTAVSAVQKILDAMPTPVLVRPDFFDIYEKADADVEATGYALGCDMIAATLDVAVDGGNGFIHFAHIGDSGIFVLHKNELVRLSEEHTLAAEERSRGNHDFPETYVNTLTRALGVGICVEPQVFSLSVVPGDRILIATDGITRTLSHEKIEHLLRDAAGTPESVAAALIGAANAAGGFDNSTAVVAFIE